MMMSGLTLCDEVRWISFHSYYDFGYLLKLLTNNKLPEKVDCYSYIHTICMYVCMYVCMQMYVCMYAYVCIFVYIYIVCVCVLCLCVCVFRW
jgi:hypothetical protein